MSGRRGPFEVALFLWVGFFILVIRHVVAENRIHSVLGRYALRMVELPELLAAGGQRILRAEVTNLHLT